MLTCLTPISKPSNFAKKIVLYVDDCMYAMKNLIAMTFVWFHVDVATILGA